MKKRVLNQPRLRQIPAVLAGLLLMSNLALAQTITGKVTDEFGKPLPGANVFIEGTKTGAAAALDGTYTLRLPDGAGPFTLTATYIGYQKASKQVSDISQSVDFQLKELAALLSGVLVTARRVEESLQKIPVAVTAFTPQELEQKGAVQIDDVARFTPNLTIDNAPAVSGAGFGTTIFIRGVGQNDFVATTDPGVGVYVDGIYIARTIGTLFEMQGTQVEVLRGPQGTTFGRNTVGGAINITTPRPTTDKVYGSVEATGGEYSLYQLRGSANLPVSENTAANLSLVYRKRDSYAERLQDGEALGDDNTFFLRGRLNSIPSEKLVLDFSADYTRTRAGSAVSTLVAANPAAFPFAVLYNQLVGNAVDPAWITKDPFKTNATGASVNDLDVYGFSGTASLDWGKSVTSKLILGYRNLDAVFSRDGDNSPFPYRQTKNTYTSAQTSAELQFFNSKRRSSGFNWLAGLYFMNENINDDAEVDLATGLFDALEAAHPDSVPGPWGGAGNPANVGLDLELFVQNEVEITNLAAFMNASFYLTEKFSLSGGIRASKDEKTYIATHQRLNSGAYIVRPNTTVSNDWTSVTGRFGLEYQANDNILTYASVSNGFKSGGFNARPLRSERGIEPFDPEKVWTYELGFKSDLAKRTRLNVSAYLSNYQDIQVTFVNTPEIVVRNAAEAEIKGVEAEFLTTVGNDFNVNLALGYTDAAYTRVESLAEIKKDTKFIKTPKLKYAIGAAYTPVLSRNVGLNVRLDYSYQDEVYHDPANTPILLQPAYGLLSARAGLLFNNKYEFAVFGRNLTDEAYLVSGLTSAAFGVTEGSYGPPRTIGTSLRLMF
jgi:iron complex outermembrane receptor protein